MSNLVPRTDHDGLARVTLNRPEKLNALTVPLFAELRDHVLALAQQTDTVGLVVLRGAGKCFWAGHDLADIFHGEKPPKPSFEADTIELLADLPQVDRKWLDGGVGFVDIKMWSGNAKGVSVGPGRIVATLPLRHAATAPES